MGRGRETTSWRVGIGILNYNTRDALLENVQGCIRSGIPANAILVLDNASTDASVESVRERYPLVQVLAADRNLGYAAGMNRIVEALETRFVILLTADCSITRETVNWLMEAMETEVNVAVAGCRIIDRRTGRIQSEGGDVTYPLGIPLARRWQEAPDPKDPGRISDVGYVDGAAYVVERKAFRDLGGFDESYFAYQEDVDLCWRARMQGYRVVCVGSAQALHGTYASFRHFPTLRQSLTERNRIATNLKNLEARHVLHAILWEAVYLGGVTFAGAALRMPGYPRAYYLGLASLLRSLRTVLAERKKVQRARTRPDRDVLLTHPKMGPTELAKALSKRVALGRKFES